MQNFFEYLVEFHKYIFTIWLALIYFFSTYYLRKLYLKLDKCNLSKSYRTKKNQSEFDILDSKSDNGHYSEEDVNVIDHRKMTLIFQCDLGVEEKNLNILRYLNSFENCSEALYLYKNCKELLTFDDSNNELKIIKTIDITNPDTKIKSINWIWNLGILINFIFILAILFEPKLSNYSESLFSILGLTFLSILLISFIIFKISRIHEKLSDAQKLLKMSRIVRDQINE